MPKLVLNKSIADQFRALASKAEAVELVDEEGRSLGTATVQIEYRPLPPFGTPEFKAEIERRRRNPGRMLTIDEAMADWDTI